MTTSPETTPSAIPAHDDSPEVVRAKRRLSIARDAYAFYSDQFTSAREELRQAKAELSDLTRVKTPTRCTECNGTGVIDLFNEFCTCVAGRQAKAAR